MTKLQKSGMRWGLFATMMSGLILAFHFTTPRISWYYPSKLGIEWGRDGYLVAGLVGLGFGLFIMAVSAIGGSDE